MGACSRERPSGCGPHAETNYKMNMNTNREEPTMTEKLDVLFRRCANSLGRGHHGRREEGHRGPGQGRIMGMIARHEPISQKELLDMADIRPSSLSEILGKIEGEGYIRRQKDEGDKRSVVISMTDEGRGIVEQTMTARRDYAQALFSCLSLEEQEQLVQLLEKLAASWEQEEGSCRGGRPFHDHHGGRGGCPEHRSGRGRPCDF